MKMEIWYRMQNNLVKFAVSGKASIVGVDNGKQERVQNSINAIT